MNAPLFIVFGIAVLVVVIFWVWWFRSKTPSREAQSGLFFESSHGPIFYQRKGTKKKPPILLLHGIGGSHYSWRLLIPLLETHFDLIVIDLWGFGLSHKNPTVPARLETHVSVLTELLDDLQVPTVHLAGASMGGAIAFWFARKHPHRILSVTTFAPAAYPGLVPSFTKRMTWLALLTPMMINRSTMERILDRIYTDKSLISSEAIETYLKPYIDRNAHKTFSNHLDLIKDSRVFKSLKDLQLPTLTLWGANDKIVISKTMDRIAREIPAPQLRVHPTAGHHVMEEDPAWCRDQILPFITELS